jgi:hypothetical protein
MKKYMGLFSRKKKVHFDQNGKAMLELKSIDPYPEDVGKDIVRMDNASMDTLDVESGDFVKIMWGTSGTRQYLNAKCLPLDSSDKNKNVIRMPGGEVNNIEIDCVIVEKIDVTSDEETSQKIMLMPIGLNAMMYLAFSQEMDNCKNIVDEKNIIETYENTIVSPYQSSIITTCFDNPCEFKVIGSDTDLSSIFITKNTTFEYHIPELTETPTSEYVGMVDEHDRFDDLQPILMTNFAKAEISLNVAEPLALQGNGKSVRIADDVMDSLHLFDDDVVEIFGKRITVFSVGLYPFDDGKGIIRITDIGRKNLKVKIGDKVRIKKTRTRDAKKIVLAPIEQIPPIDSDYFSEYLSNQPVIQGDSVIIPYFGSQLTLNVIETSPAGEVRTTSDTVFQMTDVQPTKEIVWENFYDEKKISSDNSIDQPNSVHDLFNELNTWHFAWKPKKTISVCDKILESDPENVTVLSYKSHALHNAYYEKDDTKYLEPLLSVCDKILELDSEDEEIWERKASCLQHLERYDEAIAYYDKCIELERGSWYKWHSTADTLIQLGRYTEASQCYVQAQHMADRSEGYWMSKYNSLAKLDRTKEEEDAGLKMSCLMMYSKSLGEKSREFGD